MLSNQMLSRFMGILSFVTVALVVSGCGGGDDGSSAGASNGIASGAPAPVGIGVPATPVSSGTSGGSAPVAATTSVPITVGSGAIGVVNMPTVSVTVCAPGTSQCQIIPNILLDTGSTGLRVVNSVATAVLGGLPTVSTRSGNLNECLQFVSGYTWGSVRTADVKIGQLTASGIPIQIVGDMGASSVPTSCANRGVPVNTVGDLGANGILGIGPAGYDCGATCVTSTNINRYYACSTGNASCQLTTVPLAQQVTNPVAHFPSNNDGFVVQMNQPVAGLAVGTLSFGIGSPPAGKTMLTTESNGNFRQGTFAGTTLRSVYMDTGSNGYYFDNKGLSNMPVCRDNPFYCPSATQNLSVSLTGVAWEQATVSLTVENADKVFNGDGFAFPNLAGPGNASSFGLGLPFFYGRTVYIGLDRSLFGDTRPPYIAF